MLTHGNMVSNVCQAHAWVTPYLGGHGNECIVTALPLYHVFALTANCLTFLKLGARNLLIVDPRDLATFIRTLRKPPFSAITGVSTLFCGLLNHPDFAVMAFSRLRLLLGGGMEVQRAIAPRRSEVTAGERAP